MPLALEKELDFLRQIPEFGQYLSEALRKVQEATNGLGKNVAVDPTGTMPKPPTIQQLTVKTNGTGLVHAVVSDNNPIQKGLHYFVEYSNDAAFSQPHVVHLGASRSMPPITLPGSDDNGNPQKFYFRAYSQYPGSHPGEPVHFGGDTPSAVDPGGTQQMTLVPSTGSGTAPNTGERGASGFGRVLLRPSSGPKRSAAA
jgi:hypothetical protein